MKVERFISLHELEFELLINFGINARTFQFYKSEELIPKPIRTGKTAGYNRDYLYRVLIAVKKLQDNFHMSISELKPIIKYCIKKQRFDRLHKDLKKLETDFPIIWPDSANDEEGWGTLYINNKIRRLYLLAWRLYCEREYEPAHSIEAVEGLVKHGAFADTKFKYDIETALDLMDAGTLSYEMWIKRIKQMEKLPSSG